MTRRSDGGPSAVFSMRQPVELQAWVDAYAEEHGTDRSNLVRALYEALHEGRLIVTPRPGPNPFPGQPALFPTSITPQENP